MFDYLWFHPVVTLSESLLLLASWGLIALLINASIQTLIRGVSHLKRLHSIPCHRCVFFTGHYQLKCTVRPYAALTEQAINCSDCIPCAVPRGKAGVMPCKTQLTQPLPETSYAHSTSAQQ
ncbi:MAG: hypothetical protein WA902_04875 [Thermosynechococcaceae cyanobacterium]